MSDLRNKTISSMLWSAIHRFGTMAISFVTNLVLARLLLPEDFGAIGMLLVFLAVSNVFIDGGFGAALIQKKAPSEKDYSTIFYWNLLLSVFLFGALFLSAPSIASFYRMPILKDVLRVQGLVLIINAFCIIQNNQLIKELKFKTIAKVNIIATVVGSLFGIVLAFKDFGVWSLVAKALLTAIIQCLLLWIWGKWRPLWLFSKRSLKELFSYGGLILASNLVETIYNNVQELIIGRVFSSRDLGFYTQAKQLEQIPTMSLSQIVNQVAFPVFSQIQDNLVQLKEQVKRNIIAMTYVSFPLMVLLIVIARPLIILLYSYKWVESIPYFQILCIFGMLYTLNTVNTNVYKSIGKSKLLFNVQLFKRVVSLILILFSLRFGMLGMMWAIAISGYIHFFVNGFITERTINYGIKEQIRDILPNYILSIVVGMTTYVIIVHLDLSNIVLIITSVIIYIFLYAGISYLFKIRGYDVFHRIVKERIGKRK